MGTHDRPPRPRSPCTLWSPPRRQYEWACTRRFRGRTWQHHLRPAGAWIAANYRTTPRRRSQGCLLATRRSYSMRSKSENPIRSKGLMKKMSLTHTWGGEVEGLSDRVPRKRLEVRAEGPGRGGAARPTSQSRSAPRSPPGAPRPPVRQRTNAARVFPAKDTPPVLTTPSVQYRRWGETWGGEKIPPHYLGGKGSVPHNGERPTKEPQLDLGMPSPLPGAPITQQQP